MSLAGNPAEPALSVLHVADVDSGDQSGRETFSKYRYQAKLTLSHWLTTLLPNGPIRIFSEHQEDVVIEHVDRIRFAQVKTRNPGLSRWTLAAIIKDGGGLDSLLRCHKQTSHIEHCSYDLLLEGECSGKPPNATFFGAPAKADGATKKKIADALEHDISEIHDLLQKLSIHAGQISRAHIDDRNLVTLWKMLQTVPYPAVQETYNKLLIEVENLQSGDPTADWWTDVCRSVGQTECSVPHLNPTRLKDLLPKAPIASPAEWQRLLSDPTLSDLERKLILAGGDAEDITEAKELRAIALTRIREISYGPSDAIDSYNETCSRLLRYAKGIARTHHGEPAAAKKVLGDILRTADSDMRTYDTDNLFTEHFSLAGVVCELSDECKFAWQ